MSNKLRKKIFRSIIRSIENILLELGRVQHIRVVKSEPKGRKHPKGIGIETESLGGIEDH